MEPSKDREIQELLNYIVQRCLIRKKHSRTVEGLRNEIDCEKRRCVMSEIMTCAEHTMQSDEAVLNQASVCCASTLRLHRDVAHTQNILPHGRWM